MKINIELLNLIMSFLAVENEHNIDATTINAIATMSKNTALKKLEATYNEYYKNIDNVVRFMQAFEESRVKINVYGKKFNNNNEEPGALYNENNSITFNLCHEKVFPVLREYFVKKASDEIEVTNDTIVIKSFVALYAYLIDFTYAYIRATDLINTLYNKTETRAVLAALHSKRKNKE